MICCPDCGSEDITLVDYEGGSGKPYYEFWFCNDCDNHWSEVYRLVKHQTEEE